MSSDEQPLVATARKMLVDWANQQDSWIRSLVSEILSTRQSISESVLEAAYCNYLIQKGLAEGDQTTPTEIAFDETTSPEAASFVIERLEGIEGVNALAPNQTINFNPGLTVLFGENGAGKTGYARVLKQLAAVRTAERILPNVHDATASKDLKASVTYRTGTDEATVLAWRGESGLAPFTRLSVFDSPSLHLHVDDHLTYLYTPSDLALFPLLDTAIGALKEKLDGETSAKGVGGNPYLNFFIRGTAIYTLIETLGAATDVAEIEALVDSTANPETRMEAARSNVEALRSTSIAAQLTTAKSRRDLYAELEMVGRAASAFNMQAYNDAVGAAHQASLDIQTLREGLHKAAGLAGDSDESWQAFILGGEAYVAHRGDHDYPDCDDLCIYCRQTLGEEARALIRQYQEFANDAAQKQIAAAHRTMATLTADIRGSNTANALGGIATLQDASAPDDILQQSEDLVKAVEAARNGVEGGIVLSGISMDLPVGWSEEVAARQSAATILTADLSGRVEERQQALQAAQTVLNDLADGIELAARLDGIRDFVVDAKWAQKAAQLSKRIPPVRTSLTGIAKVASEQMINTDFAKRFEEECAALRAPAVGLEFPGQKGQAARRKTVPVAKHPSDVLSEGEQKVIGLADFLAESGLRLSPSPIVLDDPVNSLDYRRIREVSDRVASLAADRQVIVFTHNIWFATELLARFERDTNRCTYYSITDDKAKGVVLSGSHPRWDTVSKTAAKVSKLIEGARAAEGAVQEALIENAYSTIRGWCETVVEIELLAGVTQRYQPNVMMTNLDKIKVDHLKAACDVISPLFKKACRITEAHSQPLETLSVRPGLSELEVDWASLLEARKTYLNASGV